MLYIPILPLLERIIKIRLSRDWGCFRHSLQRHQQQQEQQQTLLLAVKKKKGRNKDHHNRNKDHAFIHACIHSPPLP